MGGIPGFRKLYFVFFSQLKVQVGRVCIKKTFCQLYLGTVTLLLECISLFYFPTITNTMVISFKLHTVRHYERQTGGFPSGASVFIYISNGKLCIDNTIQYILNLTHKSTHIL